MSLVLNIQQIQTEIARLLAELHKPQDAVCLVAASKAQSAAIIRQAYDSGLRHFAENYVQEALEKMATLTDCAITWHMIGDLQSNKVRPVAERFAWVHTLSRMKIAEGLARHRPEHLPKLNVCIEVNIDNEATKAGLPLAEVESFAARVMQLPGLSLRGLMCIPAASVDAQLKLSAFERLHDCFLSLQQSGIVLDTLSMGMSDDYQLAIRSGATMVRIGTALFGRR